MSKNKSQVQTHLLVLLSSLIFVSYINFISCQSHVKLNCNEIEREVLLRFKKGLADPSDRLVSWTGEDCCKWRGVVCNNRTGHVVKLKLRNPLPESFEGEGSNYSLGGEISSSLLELKYLNHLDLSYNNFGGVQIPKFLGSLHRLRYLNLSNANLGGGIPESIGNLSGLRYLDLTSYTFEQVKNNLQWLSGLHSLEHLNLGAIDLTEAADRWLQDVNMLSSLRELHLPQCGLSAFPSFLPHINCSSLSVLNLANNGFDSSIAKWLFNLTKLSFLDLSSNNLKGKIPVAFSNLTSLQTLDLSENYLLEGELSKNLANLCNLKKLDLSFNNFSGQITELIDGFSICPGSKLEVLNLGYNIELGGKIPDSIGHLRNLKYLALRGNSFVGSLPDSIGNMSSLEQLYLMSTTKGRRFLYRDTLFLVYSIDLSSNNLSGQIPPRLADLHRIGTLNLSNNHLTGTIPGNIGVLKRMETLDLSRNRLTGQIPASMIDLTALNHLNLSYNNLCDKQPVWNI